MIDHMSTYATNYTATRDFYIAAFAPLKYPMLFEEMASLDNDWPTRRMCAFGPDNKPIFWVIEVKSPATPRHTAFVAANRSAVADFYHAGLASGGQDNGAPGLRPIYHEHYYGAFLLDPDGNNVEAVCHHHE
ncbi:VOC family protein [Shewanella sp.]|uniref:VOC family protein n=1 Tax=Shewanella sp. TaxID=50422 RepID=UPI003563E082